MTVYRTDTGGKVIAIWQDVASLADWGAKYALPGAPLPRDIFEGEAVPGQIRQADGTLLDPPPPPWEPQPLEPWRLWAVLDAAGLSAGINGVIDAIADPLARAAARRRFEMAPAVTIEDPIWGEAIAAGVLDRARLEELWRQAEGL